MDILRVFVTNYPLWYHFIIVILSLFLLAKAAYYLVFGISNYAKKFGISNYLVGLLVVAAGASAPEFLASLSGVFRGSSSVVFGTIFGSNMIGLTAVLGIIAFVGKKVPMDQKVFEKTKWDVLILIALPFLLLLDGVLGFFDGIILVVAFFFYAYMLWTREKKMGKLKKTVKVKIIYKDALIFILSLVVVLLASRFLVDSSLEISSIMSLHPFLVATVLIGFGSSVPDLFLGLHSLKEKCEAVALGDVLGSVILKSILFFGVFALMTTLTFSVYNTIFIGILTIASSMLLFYFVKKNYLSRSNGVILILVYAAFLAIQFWFFA